MFLAHCTAKNAILTLIICIISTVVEGWVWAIMPTWHTFQEQRNTNINWFPFFFLAFRFYSGTLKIQEKQTKLNETLLCVCDASLFWFEPVRAAQRGNNSTWWAHRVFFHWHTQRPPTLKPALFLWVSVFFSRPPLATWHRFTLRYGLYLHQHLPVCQDLPSGPAAAKQKS